MGKLRREHSSAIPEIVASDLDAERPWFAMPWFGDGSLEAAVTDTRFRREPRAGLHRLTQLVQILADVHAAGVAHRDLKPANVLLQGGSVFLTDFGLCLDLDEPESRITEQHEAIGSRLYIAPENEGGINLDIDQRPADFYAFGKLAWAVMTGSQPLPRELILESPARLAELLDNPKLSALDGLLRDLLNRDPRARLSEWRVVLRELRAVESDLEGVPKLTTRPASERSLTLARRLRESSTIQTSVDQRAQEQRQQAWIERLDRELFDRARTIDASVAAVNREFGDILSIVVSRSNPAQVGQLAAAGLDLPHELAGAGPVTYPASGAICFVIQSGIRTLPSVLVRVWPIVQGDQMWLASLPSGAAPGTGEAPVDHLNRWFAGISGPFAVQRQSTVEESIERIDRVARLFVALVEEFLEIVDAGGDVLDPRAWDGKALEPADVVRSSGAVPGDSQPPDLRSFDFAPSVIELVNDSIAVTCRARLVDELAGVAGEGYSSSHSQARFRSPSGQIRDVMFDQRARVSGDSFDGVYEATLALPAHAERGFWNVEYLLAADQVGNTHVYMTAELRDRGFKTRLEVR
jgi:Protein kinase domain